ncbi:MAG: crotonase/enoyl-CoA hydratase family protein [Novosphingobium sp.]|nr:crotonase/enoyl-CoA hydratase family protein [Novosphingobium sp.]
MNELDVLYEPADEVLWTFMRPAGRPSFTPPMLGDFEDWQRLILAGFGAGRTPLKYLVLGSRAPGVFCFGGDLELFGKLIRTADRAGLVRYGYRCVEILHRNINALDLPILTVGLVQGAALGGGFEALLSFDHVIAERNATFGLPEVMFGLFPGMGAHAILSRKLGAAAADRIILSNKTYSAEEMYDLGVVQEIVEDGAGIAATRAYFARNARRHAGLVGAKRAMRESSHVPLAELKRIVDHWAESALQLREQDLKLMQRLVNAQTRLVAS